MGIDVDRQSGYVEVRVTGPLGDRDVADAKSRLDALAGEFEGGQEESSLVLWDFTGAGAVSRRGFVTLIWAIHLYKLLERDSVIVAPTPGLSQYLKISGLDGLLRPCRDTTEALERVLRGRRREYSREFLGFLVENHYLTRDQLAGILAQKRASEGSTTIEALLLESRLFNWRTLFMVHHMFQRQRHPAPTPAAAVAAGAAYAATDGTTTSPGRARAPGAEPGLDTSPGRARAPGAEPGLVTSPGRVHPALERGLTSSPGQVRPGGGSEFVRKGLMGEILVELGVISAEDLRQALDEHRRAGPGARLGDILTHMGLVTDEQVFAALEQQYERRGGKAPRPPAPEAAGEPESRPSSGSEFVKKGLLGEILLELGLVTPESLKRALDEQKRSPDTQRLGAILLRLGIVTRDQIFVALETQARRKGRRA